MVNYKPIQQILKNLFQKHTTIILLTILKPLNLKTCPKLETARQPIKNPEQLIRTFKNRLSIFQTPIKNQDPIKENPENPLKKLKTI